MINYDSAKNELLSGRVETCINFFKNNNYLLEYGYALIFENRLDEAESVLSSIDSVRSDWALSLIQFMRGYVGKYPKYFQIRNFLEIDINLLILYNKQDYINYILGGSDIFYSINCESYKYLARVFMNNGFFDVAKIYIDKGVKLTNNDPELYYIATMYYIMMQDYEKALFYLNKCLEILPEYFPAVRLKTKLEERINSL